MTAVPETRNGQSRNACRGAGGTFVETGKDDMSLTRRGGFLIMLAANHAGVAVLFLIAFAAPDAVWSVRAIYVVLGLLLLTIGNWFVVRDWGPNGREAQLERVRAGRDMRTTSWVLPADLVDRIAEAADTQRMSPCEWAESVLTRALGRRGQGT